ncbi:MAG TPA: transporter substrate-binding domain-containing protein [Jatrophihabitans sp.]|nr:transporter substrate-binding domain-containing protein [Jatrophihabitans sp.]
MQTIPDPEPQASAHTDRPAGRRRVRLVAAALAVAAAAAGLAACSSSGKSSAGSTGSTGAAGTTGSSSSAGSAAGVTIAGHTITADPALVAQLPAAIKSKGELTDITYNNAPPDEAVVDGKLVGWEVDLGAAVAATLGLKWNVTASGAFDSFIPGLQNGRYNVSFTSFIQTPDRLKQIDIVTYYNVGTGFAVKSGSSISIKTPTDVCGHTVSVIAGSAFIQQLQGIKCAAAGKPAVKVQSFPSDSAAELAVSSGRVEVYSSSMDQLSWLVEQTHGQFTLQSLDYQPVPEGAGVTKGIGLTKPVAAAMDKLIQTGVYSDIMKKWSITQGGLVTKSTIYSTSGANGS